MNEQTEVVFRKYRDGQIIALFPYDVESFYGNCSSYMHVGQHSSANYLGVIAETKPASPKDYKDLKKELENYGPKEANYNLKVISRINWNKYREIFSKTKTERWNNQFSK